MDKRSIVKGLVDVPEMCFSDHDLVSPALIVIRS